MLIGISGPKYSGKDTCGQYLVEKYEFKCGAFAETLKIICKELFLLKDEQMYGTEEQKETIDERWGYSPRKIMQTVGTDCLQKRMGEIFPLIGEEIFVKCFKLKHKEFMKGNFVITDVRFEQDRKFIKENGGYIIRVERENTLKDSHESEKGVECDFMIENNGTLNELYQKLDDILNYLNTKK